MRKLILKVLALGFASPLFAQDPVKKPRKVRKVSATGDASSLEPGIESSLPSTAPQEANNKSEPVKSSTTWPTKVPSRMFGLGLTTTPSKPFEDSLSGVELFLGDAKVKIAEKSGSGDQEVTGKIQSGTILASHRLSLMNRRVQISAELFMSRMNSNLETKLQASGTAASIKSKKNDDTPGVTTTIGFQARQGLWVGMGTRWQKKFTKVESETTIGATAQEKETSTRNNEDATFLVGLEYASFPGHMGVEYSSQVESKEVTAELNIPMRLALTETLFADLNLERITKNDASDYSQAVNHHYTVGIGQQFPASAYKIAVQLDTDKSWTIADYTNRRGMSYYGAGFFGPPKGIQMGFELGMTTSTSLSSSNVETKINGLIGAVKVEYVN